MDGTGTALKNQNHFRWLTSFVSDKIHKSAAGVSSVARQQIYVLGGHAKRAVITACFLCGRDGFTAISAGEGDMRAGHRARRQPDRSGGELSARLLRTRRSRQSVVSPGTRPTGDHRYWSAITASGTSVLPGKFRPIASATDAGGCGYFCLIHSDRTRTNN